MKSVLSDLKPIKTKKQPGTTYCFGCKDYTKYFRPREKFHRIVWWSNKLRFLKQ